MLGSANYGADIDDVGAYVDINDDAIDDDDDNDIIIDDDTDLDE